MDEAIEIYTKRVVKECKEEVERVNDRYPGHELSQLRFDTKAKHQHIAIGKIACLDDLNHITRDETVKLMEEVRGLK